MTTILFRNPTFHSGINVTVRRGIKWAETHGRVVAQGTVDKIYTPLNILRTKVIRFCDITQGDMDNEHDPDCRNYHGLWAEMACAYHGFDEQEIVTVVYFEVIKNAEDIKV